MPPSDPPARRVRWLLELEGPESPAPDDEHPPALEIASPSELTTDWRTLGAWRVRRHEPVPPASSATAPPRSEAEPEPEPEDDEHDPAAWAAPELRLTTITGTGRSVRTVRLPLDPALSWTIGRDADCDLTIEDTYLSRRHLRLFAQDGAIHVEDLDSRWGTMLDRAPLAGVHRLRHGDELGLGQTRIVYSCYLDELDDGGLLVSIPGGSQGDEASPAPSDAAPGDPSPALDVPPPSSHAEILDGPPAAPPAAPSARRDRLEGLALVAGATLVVALVALALWLARTPELGA